MEVATHAHGVDLWVAALLAMTDHSRAGRPSAGVELAMTEVP
jgi:hypothetical protein